MPFNTVPVDQGQFTNRMLIEVNPKVDKDGVQYRDNDNVPKWAVKVVWSKPSQWGVGRTDTSMESVTITSAEDPGRGLQTGSQVWFDNLEAGKTPAGKDKRDPDTLRQGQWYFSATGVRVRVLAPEVSELAGKS